MGEGRERQQPLIVGDYALFGEIASGGMATVHFGRLLGPKTQQKTVAIKRLHAQFAQNPDFVDMFLDEGRVASHIHHPNVVPVLDVAMTGDELFLVMEYVHGETLSKLLSAGKARKQRVPPPVAFAIVIDLLNGLHAAHEAADENGEPLNIVHRDVSPPNIMVGSDGLARVLDFGVAKAAGRLHLTRDRQLKGKLTYMAPEQVRGQGMDRRTDVYAASIVLWELLVGRSLFDGANEAVVLTQVMNANIEAPSKLGAPVSAVVDGVVLKGLERDAARRYPTAKAMAEALAQVAPVASPEEVGAWVMSLASAQMEARAHKLVEIGELAADMELPEGWPTETRLPAAAMTGTDPDAPVHPPPPERPTPAPAPSQATITSAVKDVKNGRTPPPWWLAPTLVAAVGVLGMAAVLAWPSAPAPSSSGAATPTVANDSPMSIELPNDTVLGLPNAAEPDAGATPAAAVGATGGAPGATPSSGGGPTGALAPANARGNAPVPAASTAP